jgi:hypothetical protein
MQTMARVGMPLLDFRLRAWPIDRVAGVTPARISPYIPQQQSQEMRRQLRRQVP